MGEDHIGASGRLPESLTPTSSRETKERHGGVLEDAMLRAITLLVLLLTPFTSLHAGDGVLEIN